MLSDGATYVVAGHGEGAFYTQGVRHPQNKPGQGWSRGLFWVEPPFGAAEARVVEREHLMAFGDFGYHRQPDVAPEGAVQEQDRRSFSSPKVADPLSVKC